MDVQHSIAAQGLDLVRPVLAQPEAVLLGLVFLAAFLTVLGVAGLTARDPVRRRLSAGVSQPPPRPAGGSLSVRSPSDPKVLWEVALTPVDAVLANGARRGLPALRLRLRRAGFAGATAVRTYVALRTILAAGAPLAFVVAAAAQDWGVPLRDTILIAAGLGALGLALPSLWLSRRIAQRTRMIVDGFPDALDMMVVCVEAGLGLDAALTRVGTQVAPTHPILAVELNQVTLELRAGKSREDALRNLAARVGLREVSAFVTLLIQTEALGTSIAQALRVHAEEMRQARLLRAEERAHTLPVKLTIPLVVCILPAMLAVVLLPGIIGIVRDVLPHLGT